MKIPSFFMGKNIVTLLRFGGSLEETASSAANSGSLHLHPGATPKGSKVP